MEIRIALAGNPNSGKSTLFNALTGSNQFVGNWPGVTVEKKEGRLKGYREVRVIDLPGIYSLSPYTLEEVVARNYLLGERPEVILNLIDGTNLERNLYLTTQLAELGIPMIAAVNMMDTVEKSGDYIDADGLSRELGCPVVELSALKGTGVEEAAEAAVEAAASGLVMQGRIFSPLVEKAVNRIEGWFPPDKPEVERRWYAIKLMERDGRVWEELRLDGETENLLEEEIRSVEEIMDDDAESIMTSERYTFITEVMKKCCKKRKRISLSPSDWIDRIVTNRWLALPVFALVMFAVYFVSVTTVGTWATDWANDGLFGEGFSLFGAEVPGVPVLVERVLDAVHCAGWLKDLVLDGIVGGVGAVLGFVPQMLVLFFFLAFLESCGYMARVAFVMDRIFRRFGLSGKSFIPMLISTGCGIPGIMASRTIENERDRRMTVMTTTFIPCGAKLPIIALIAGALLGGAWWVAPSAYFIGVAAVVISGVILKKTRMFSGDPAPFVMELPAYHWPAAGGILRSMWERAWSFVKKAGTVILLSSVLLWFLQGFGVENGNFGMVEDLENSLLAALGGVIAWIFSPLGWGNWQSAVATITGLIAKENVVGTFGVLFGGFGEVAEDGRQIWANMRLVFTPLSAFSFLIFNLLCAPCFAAMGAIKREMNSARWTLFAIGYQCVFAYVISFIVYQLGMLFTGNGTPAGSAAAILLAAFTVYLMARPYRDGGERRKSRGTAAYGFAAKPLARR